MGPRHGRLLREADGRCRAHSHGTSTPWPSCWQTGRTGVRDLSRWPGGFWRPSSIYANLFSNEVGVGSRPVGPSNSLGRLLTDRKEGGVMSVRMCANDQSIHPSIPSIPSIPRWGRGIPWPVGCQHDAMFFFVIKRNEESNDKSSKSKLGGWPCGGPARRRARETGYCARSRRGRGGGWREGEGRRERVGARGEWGWVGVQAIG